MDEFEFEKLKSTYRIVEDTGDIIIEKHEWILGWRSCDPSGSTFYGYGNISPCGGKGVYKNIKDAEIKIESWVKNIQKNKNRKQLFKILKIF